MLHLDAQEYFDRVEFDPTDGGYKELSKRDQKIRHIQLHVAKAALKLVKRDNEIIMSQVIPDLAIYRSQLVNLLAEPARDAFLRELNSQKSAASFKGKQKGLSIVVNADYEYLKDEIITANGNLASYLERLEHGEPGDEDIIFTAAYRLDSGANGLAELYEMNLEQAHLARLEENLGQTIPPDLT
jgi:hypothetical protein